jgi:hypothetical protein
MTIGRHYELLLSVVSRKISEARRKELLELASRWMESDACPACTPEEMFYLWAAMTGVQIKAYSEHLQSVWGAEVMDDLGANVDA